MEGRSKSISIPDYAARRGRGLIGRVAIAAMRIEEPELLSESETSSESDSAEEVESVEDDDDDDSPDALSDSSSELELECERLRRVSNTPSPRFCG
jgi:hypothetical protein